MCPTGVTASGGDSGGDSRVVGDRGGASSGVGE